MSEKFEKVTLSLLILSFLLGLGLVEYRRQRPSFTLEVLSEKPPLPVPSPKISLNSATEDELTRLPGIGPKLAQRIVATRSRQGRFASLEELLAVKGIGQKLLERISPYLKTE